MQLNFILWNVNPEIFNLGPLPIRWYGLLFVLTFIIAPKIANYIYRTEKRPVESIEPLVMHLMIGTLAGARLGHVIFYEFTKIFTNPLEVFLPISLTPRFHFTGYRGLASHGALFGLIISIYIFVNYKIKFKLFPFHFSVKKEKRRGQNFLWSTDIIAIFVAMAAICIRLGNFANSEIYGIPTKKPFGVVFGYWIKEGLMKENPSINQVRIKKDLYNSSNRKYLPLEINIKFNKSITNKEDIINFTENHLKYYLTNSYVSEHLFTDISKPLNYGIVKKPNEGYIVTLKSLGIPRHASQFYEALSSFFLFIFLFLIWKFKWKNLREGTLSGILLIYVFALRFFYEFFKESNMPFPKVTSLTTPQLLSIIAIIIGILFLSLGKKTHGEGQLKNL